MTQSYAGMIIIEKIIALNISLISSGATKDIDWLGPKGLDLNGIKERGNKYIIFVWSVENYVHIGY